MGRISLRGLAAHKLRTALTAFAIFLGVAMVSGTLVLTDTINRAFDSIFDQAAENVDVVVAPAEEFTALWQEPPSFDEAIVDRVREVDGVAAAEPAIYDLTVRMVDEEDEPIGPPGPPHIALSELETEHFEGGGIAYIEGSPPAAPGELGIDTTAAEREGFELGDGIRVTGAGGARTYAVSGIFQFGREGTSLVGASLITFTFAEAQRITGKVGEVDGIQVATAEGVGAEELRDRIAAALGGEEGITVRTGAEDAVQQADRLKESFSFLTIALLVFAGIAVFVGAFLIFNTFSIIVAQRTREFAMLRTLGASRRQVLRVVGLEAAGLALPASLLGLGGGFLYVPAMTALFDALGFTLPAEDPVFTGRTAAIGMTVGLVTTGISALVPAVRATRVSPLEALREAAGARHRRRRAVTALGAALAVGGLAAMAFGLFSASSATGALSSMGAGLVLLFVGVAILSPLLVPPLAATVGRPIELLTRITGRLSRENAIRNPGRTATTAAALMIGVALVGFVAIFASSLSRSIDEALQRSFAGDIALRNTDGFSNVPGTVAPAIQEIDGVAVVSPFRYSEVEVMLDEQPERSFIGGFDPETLPEVFAVEWAEGSDAVLEGFGPADAIARESWAEDNGIGVGDRVVARSAQGREAGFTVRGIIDDPFSLVTETFAVRNDVMARAFGVRDDSIALAAFEPGADVGATRERIDTALSEGFPNVVSEDQQELTEAYQEQINQLLALIYGLLALSIIVSLFGVVNTMALAIRERMREIGLLRAVGTSRWQIRSTIAGESVITALIGGILGLGVGLVLAVLTVAALAGEGISLAVPVATLAIVLLVAGIVGVLASVLPARRAARIDILEAIAHE